MLVRLTSSTSGTMVMFAAHAHVLFGWIGKECTARGVFTEDQLPDAIARLHQGVAAEKEEIRRRAEEKENSSRPLDGATARKNDAEGADQEEKDDTEGGRQSAEPVSLVQRAQPLIRLMEWTQKEGGYILWEAAADF